LLRRQDRVKLGSRILLEALIFQAQDTVCVVSFSSEEEPTDRTRKWY
jgi:hypothetical protein